MPTRVFQTAPGVKGSEDYTAKQDGAESELMRDVKKEKSLKVNG